MQYERRGMQLQALRVRHDEDHYAILKKPARRLARKFADASCFPVERISSRIVPEGGIPFHPLPLLCSRPTDPRSREESLARDGFNDFWGLPGMAPFLRTGEGGRGVRGIFKPLLSVGTLFSGTLVVALSPQLLPRRENLGVVCFGSTA